ncbi:hypothetical protein HDA40_003541 [Hamadaea flava]|uniref:DUF397 domain-containing protein n=1 Tax=Hamadaea flava TaxID=1742688 RepID=A0ABV8LJ90_9ACTN|nr:DUF397 domain-containing protein [Hamadaea flava]MCP2325034.1 hypothetical protein [Hamadaea flava]
MSDREQWRRAAGCESTSCAEVRRDGDDVLIRSSLAPAQMVRLTDEEWRVFRAGVAAGDFDERSARAE